MLRRITLCAAVLSIVIAGYFVWTVTPVAVAEECVTTVEPHGGLFDTGVQVGVSCTGSTGSSSSGTGSNSNKPTPCVDAAGLVVPCVKNGRTWTPYHQTWCVSIPTPQGRSGDGWVECESRSGDLLYWTNQKEPDTTPQISPEQVARNAVASIGLHAATLEVGAWVDPEYREYGITWWVGAPLWLWIDHGDSLAWGHHDLNASEGGVGIHASVDATQVTYTMGDGSTQTCDNPGVERPNRPDELMANESPAHCQHRYQDINTLGDPHSRYTITGTVTWTVSWTSTLNTSGRFTLTVPTTTTQVHIGEIRITRG